MVSPSAVPTAHIPGESLIAENGTSLVAAPDKDPDIYKHDTVQSALTGKPQQWKVTLLFLLKKISSSSKNFDISEHGWLNLLESVGLQQRFAFRGDITQLSPIRGLADPSQITLCSGHAILTLLSACLFP